MRVIVKPAGLVILGLVALGGIAVPALRGKLAARSTAGSGSNLSLNDRWKMGLEHGGQGSLDAFVADGAPALRATTTQKGADPWNVSMSLPLKSALQDGEILKFSFRARASVPRNIPVVFQKNTPGFPTFWKAAFMIGPNWQTINYEVKCVACKEWEPMAAFHLGEAVGNFEITNISITRK